MEPAPTVSKNNCLYLIMPTKLFWFFHISTCFSHVGNLTHDATRHFLLKEPFLLIRSYAFLCSWCAFICCCFMQITHLYKHTLSLIKSLHQELFGIFLFSLKTKLRMIPCLHKDFSEIKVLIQNKNQIGVCSNKKVLEIQVIS